MRSLPLPILLLLAGGCLDFDVFQTETDPTTTSSSTGGGGAGVGGAGGAATTGSTSSGMGGMAGAGGAGGGETPSCGNLQDSFDGGAELNWMIQGGATFSGDVAVAVQNSSFALNPSKSTSLLGCSVWIDVVQDSNNHVYFGWTAGGGTVRFITNVADSPFVQIAQPGQGYMDQPLLDLSTFTEGTIRISESAGTFHVETRAAGSATWTPRLDIPTATVPWLSDSDGRAVFGLEGVGVDAHFDDFGIP